jgi:hypothetical protein
VIHVDSREYVLPVEIILSYNKTMEGHSITLLQQVADSVNISKATVRRISKNKLGMPNKNNKFLTARGDNDLVKTLPAFDSFDHDAIYIVMPLFSSRP